MLIVDLFSFRCLDFLRCFSFSFAFSCNFQSSDLCFFGVYLCVYVCVFLCACVRAFVCVLLFFFWCGCVSVFLGAVSLTAAGVCAVFFLFSFEGPKLFFLLGSVLVAAVD
jgi:hypothetical protein